MYGLLEKQFRKYFDIASRTPQNTGEALISLLERRLDNVVYRLGLAPTRTAARQFVTHRHVLVDNQRVTIPSFMTRPDMVISLRPKLMETPLLRKLLEEKNPNIPSWLARKGPVGKIEKIPQRQDILEDINEQLIIEFYSR